MEKEKKKILSDSQTKVWRSMYIAESLGLQDTPVSHSIWATSASLLP